MIIITRCFFGAKITQLFEYQERAKSIAIETNSKLKIVDPNLYHFTLHFFGEITDDQINQIKTEISIKPINQFEIELGAPGVLPTKSKARVLYIAITKGINPMQNLAKNIRNQLNNLGYPIETRPFTAHLTIARVKYTKDYRLLSESWLNSNFKPITLKIERITLFKSTLSSKGSIYESIKEYELS